MNFLIFFGILSSVNCEWGNCTICDYEKPTVEDGCTRKILVVHIGYVRVHRTSNRTSDVRCSTVQVVFNHERFLNLKSKVIRWRHGLILTTMFGLDSYHNSQDMFPKVPTIHKIVIEPKLITAWSRE